MNSLRLTLLLVALAVVGVTYGQTGDDYILTRSVVSCGGGQSSGGQYALTGTISQPDAGYSYGGDYELLGGFWPGGPLYFVDLKDFARFAELWLNTDGLASDLDNDVDLPT